MLQTKPVDVFNVHNFAIHINKFNSLRLSWYFRNNPESSRKNFFEATAQRFCVATQTLNRSTVKIISCKARGSVTRDIFGTPKMETRPDEDQEWDNALKRFRRRRFDHIAVDHSCRSDRGRREQGKCGYGLCSSAR